MKMIKKAYEMDRIESCYLDSEKISENYIKYRRDIKVCFQIFFFFQAEDGIRDYKVTGVQTCALPIYDLGAMVGRQTPILALFVPLILVGIVDGLRGIRAVWPAALIGGTVFAVAQFACSDRKSGVEGKRVDLGGRRII